VLERSLERVGQEHSSRKRWVLRLPLEKRQMVVRESTR